MGNGELSGTVSWFNDTKGFGFIKSGDKDYFVHYSEIQSEDRRKTLRENQEVRFTPKQGPKGIAASKVSIINGH